MIIAFINALSMHMIATISHYLPLKYHQNAPASSIFFLHSFLSLIQDGRTGLMEASYRGYTEIVKVLAEAKADPNITDKVKHHYTNYCYCIVQIRSGSCISLQDGNTALILAASEDRTTIVKILVEHGADIDIINNVSA